MEMDMAEILRDLEQRLRALDEARQLQVRLAGAVEQLQKAKAGAARAEIGSSTEWQFLQEATEANSRVALLRDRLQEAERTLRRTAYLVGLLS